MTTTFRNPSKDKLKSQSVLKEQIKRNLTCCMPNCNEPVSMFDGPGSDVLCRVHQLDLIDYGGYGRLNKLHTFHRADVCSCCGQDINEDPRWAKAEQYFGVALTPEEKHEIKRRYNHGDHNQIRKADGGSDAADNIKAMCSFCHWVKTVANNDSRRSNSPKDSPQTECKTDQDPAISSRENP
jgi:hypothetical protein